MEDGNKLERLEPISRAIEVRSPSHPPSYLTVEAEEAPDLVSYWRVIRKRRWTIATVFFVLFTVVFVGTLKQTPIYRAKALLEIQPENPNILTVQELFELGSVSDTYLETQYKVLQSESLARRVIDHLKLYKFEEFNPPKSWFSSSGQEPTPVAQTQTFAVGDAGTERDARVYQSVLARFSKRLGVAPIKRSRLVEITFESEDSKLAAQIVNTLASNYIEQNLEARWEATQKASEWLSQQLISLKGRLEKSEGDLQEYARAQGLLFLARETGIEENIINQRLRQLQQELASAQAARFERESLYRLLENGDYASLPGVFDNKLMQDLTIKLADLKRQYAQLATTFTPEYPRVREIQNQIDEIEGVLTGERQRAAQRITNDYIAALRREKLLRQAFEAEQAEANQIAERSVQYNILKREVDTNKQLYEGLLQRLKEAGVSAGLKSSNIRIVDAADPPLKPARPRVLVNLALAVIFGLSLGLAGAFFQEYLDNTLKSANEVERILRVPALALIPSAESQNGRRGGIYRLYGRDRLLPGGIQSSEQEGLRTLDQLAAWLRIDNIGNQFSAIVEAFRGLRTSVLLSTAGHPPRSLVLTSAQPGEGKTTVSLNLSITLAQLGKRVLMIDGDMRRPCLHKALKVKNDVGLASYLTGQEDWQAALQSTGIPGLSVMVCGPIPPNPADLLASERMGALIQKTTTEYDFVVIDSPPLLNAPDARILSAQVEGVILVVKGGVTPRELVRQAQLHARDVGANIIGVVLNNMDVRAGDYYSYSYYGYSSERSGEDASNKS